MKTRKVKIKEIPELRRLILNCINKDYHKYSKLKAMKEYSSEENLKKYIKKWDVFVFLENNKIKGTISLEDGKVAFSLYSLNSKIKKELIKFIEEKCIKKKCQKIIAIVMPEYKKDFLSNGFKVAKKIVLSFGKIKFNEFKMEKTLK